MADYKQSRCLSAGEREQVSFPGREPPPENRRGSSAGAPAPVGHRGERGPCYAQDEILLTAEHIFSSNDSYLLTLDKAICLGSQPGRGLSPIQCSGRTDRARFLVALEATFESASGPFFIQISFCK